MDNEPEPKTTRRQLFGAAKVKATELLAGSFAGALIGATGMVVYDYIRSKGAEDKNVESRERLDRTVKMYIEAANSLLAKFSEEYKFPGGLPPSRKEQLIAYQFANRYTLRPYTTKMDGKNVTVIPASLEADLSNPGDFPKWLKGEEFTGFLKDKQPKIIFNTGSEALRDAGSRRRFSRRNL